MPWQHAFEARIVVRGDDRYRFTAIFLPESIAQQLPFDESPRLRFTGVIGAASINGAWQPSNGSWYCYISKKTLTRSGYRAGDLAMFRFSIESNEVVRVPEPLQLALNANRKTLAAWNRLTPGRRRGLCHMVASAKRPPTIAKRVAEVLEVIQGVNN